MPSVELRKRNILVIGGSYAGKYNIHRGLLCIA